MLEYSANAAVKIAMTRAHAARGAVLKQALRWLVSKCTQPGLRPRVSRWA
ncbi:hypothetical protein KUV61_17075 [Nocardioides marinus]|nr:hypothetical protein [Nocardioides marinus]